MEDSSAIERLVKERINKRKNNNSDKLGFRAASAQGNRPISVKYDPESDMLIINGAHWMAETFRREAKRQKVLGAD